MVGCCNYGYFRASFQMKNGGLNGHYFALWGLIPTLRKVKFLGEGIYLTLIPGHFFLIPS